jgi:ATP-dependent Clp protease ATP-binding subunit ClpX
MDISSPHPSAKKLTPSMIAAHLDQYVIGQDGAKKTLAVALYVHYRRLDRQRAGETESVKSNILLIGPTGTGKTLLCETLSRIARVPFVTANATALAQSKFVNEEIEALLTRLLEKAGGDLVLAQHGIVFIDEIDKLKTHGDESRGSFGEHVQHALLKIMEGAPVHLAGGRTMDTAGILFICAGAFVGLEEIMAVNQPYGFIGVGGGEDGEQKILDRLNRRVKPNDLFTFGLIPEFAGRLPVVAMLQNLSREQLVRVMIEPRNSIYSQFAEVFRDEGVELAIERAAFEQIAGMAVEFNVGARSLRGILEEMLTPVLYQIPDRPEVRRVVIESLFEEARFVTA